MPATMRDIARDLGVSVVTVSKVLRNHEDIGEATRKRVLERVKELNYTPNIAARGLVTGKTYLVGLVVPDLMHPFFAEVAKAISRALLKKGYCLTISTSEEDPELEEQEIQRLLGRRLDALVVASSCATGEIFERMQQQGPPFVLIDRSFPDLDAHFIGADDEEIGRLATNHLIEIGCKRIAHIGGRSISTSAGRLKGYMGALASHDMKPLPEYVTKQPMTDVQSQESGADAMKNLLALDPRPDGVFCFNDPMAIGALHSIHEAGLRVPDDIAVIGSGNLHYDSELRVPLSSIDQQTDQIGERAARLTLSLLESKKRPRAKSIIIQPRLVIRASTQKNG